MAPVIIRCDIGHQIGLGHYYRCCLLKSAFRRNGVECQLALKNIDNKNEDFSSLPYDILIEGNYIEETTKYNFQNQKLILDIYHIKNHKNGHLINYYSELKKYNNKIAFIEGLHNDSCPPVYYKYIDALITPYLTDKSFKKSPGIEHFYGENFLLLSEERLLKKKLIHTRGKRLLITFGGSDPHQQTIRVLECLQQDDRSKNVEVKIVIGSLMHPSQLDEIKQLVHFTPFKDSQIETNIHNLKPCFDWADLALTNTGQTRYELAASGIPFIIYPFDHAGYEISRIFHKLKCAVLQDVFTEHLCQNINETIFNLLENFDKRLEMSKNGVKYFCSTQGADYLVKNLMKVWQ